MIAMPNSHHIQIHMIAMPNSHLVLHKETLKQHFEKKISIKHLIKIIWGQKTAL